jgi:hypothetical protein
MVTKWQVVAKRLESCTDPENWIDKTVRLTVNRTCLYVSGFNFGRGVSGFSRT